MEKYKNRIKETLLSEENKDKDKITPQMRQQIANNEEILDSDFSETNLPECIRLYITALGGLKAADRKLRNCYALKNSYNNRRNYTYNYNSIIPDFLQDRIAIYDRFIKAKKELKECQDYKYILKLEAASPSIGKELAQNLNPPSQT